MKFHWQTTPAFPGTHEKTIESVADRTMSESGEKENPESTESIAFSSLGKFAHRADKVPTVSSGGNPAPGKRKYLVAWILGGSAALVAVLWIWGFVEAMVEVQQGGMSLWDYSQKRNSMNFISRSGMEFYLDHFASLVPQGW